MQQTGSGTGSGASWRIEYPAGPDAPSLPGWDGWTVEAAPNDHEGPTRNHGHGVNEAGVRAELEKQLGEETRRSFEAGREKGRLEGRQSEREAQAAALAAAEEHRVRQAAELALMVAARILRREAQMDPLLLTGAVRVALGQLSGSTQVRLRVPPAELALWTETILRLPKLAVKPEVLSGEGMRLGDCTIETEMGSVDLGVRSQLGEIERGFFDRVGASRAEVGAGPEPPASGQTSGQKDRL